MSSARRLSVGWFALTLLVVGSAGAQDAGIPLPDVRTFDFRNFLYSSLHGVRIRLHDGSWRRPPRQDAINGEWLSLSGVVYGDLTGDGREEAVVWLTECTGGTGQFSYANVFTATGGAPERIGRVDVGDRADGGIAAIRIVNGRLEVDRFGHDRGGAMDEEWVETETWTVRPTGLSRDAITDRRACRFG